MDDHVRPLLGAKNSPPFAFPFERGTSSSEEDMGLEKRNEDTVACGVIDFGCVKRARFVANVEEQGDWSRIESRDGGVDARSGSVDDHDARSWSSRGSRCRRMANGTRDGAGQHSWRKVEGSFARRARGLLMRRREKERSQWRPERDASRDDEPARAQAA